MLKKILRKTQSFLSLLKPISVEAANHDYLNVFLKSKKDVEELLSMELSDATVLIIGCGYRYPDVLLYSCFAKEVYGVDVLNIFFRDGFRPLYRYYRNKGKSIFYSLVVSFGKRAGLQKNYYDHISSTSQLTFDHSKLSLMSYDGEELPFEDNKFDFILSNAVLEHVQDLEVFFRELKRVTKPGGISYHLYHNFYSFSGGHYSSDLAIKNPWGHLRGIYDIDPDHLNKATPKQVLDDFAISFDINKVFQVDKNHSKKAVDERFQYEGQEWLSEDIRKELSQFSDEQLLTRSYLVIGIKK